MTVYTCSPDLASILTCIYEAWNSRLGYRNVRLMAEPVGNLELFCDYCHVEPDTEKAASVTRSIQKKIGAAACQRSGSATGTMSRNSRVQPSWDSLSRETRVSAA